jgi:DNA-binding MltR family transcriptional regulator
MTDMPDALSVAKEIIDFLARLADESERAAVVMGVALVDESLEDALVKLLLPAKTNPDELFAPDRPVGSFGARIRLAYRLGLVDDEFCSVLSMLRRIRNDFAHSAETKTLKDQEHFNRVCQMKSYASTTGIWETLVEATRPFISSEILLDFIAAIAVMVTCLKYLKGNLERIQLNNQASFKWNMV